MTKYGMPLLASLALLAGCATGPQIYTNSDPAGNFAAYRTYNFAEPLGTDRPQYSSLLTQYLKTAVSRELGARGYQMSDDPDLLVNFFTESKEKVQSTTTAGPGAGGYYGWRSGYYGVWGGYETRVTQYTEGTLVIDLIDARRNQLVWEGIAVDRVREDTRRNPQNAVDQVVAQVFAEFPWRAGARAN
jgi:hypothetical protein